MAAAWTRAAALVGACAAMNDLTELAERLLSWIP